MSTKITLAAAALLVLATPAFASHHRPMRHAARVPASVDTLSPYDIIARQTEAEQRAPGVTNELAPDAKETATGGPVGGVPGFDGN